MRDESNKLKYIGTIEAGAPNFVSSFGAGGLEHKVLAISKDGHSILFNHWAIHAPLGSNLKNGIYRYRYGDEPIRVIDTKPMSTASWVQWPKPLPKDILPFSYRPVTFTSDDMTWAISVDDLKPFPLALLDARPIHRCAFDGDTQQCKELLTKGVNINIETYWGFTPLDLAIIQEHVDTAIYLLKHGANPNDGIYSAIHNAVAFGQMRIVRILLEQGVDVNKQDRCGSTPLHIAIYAGRKSCGGIRSFFPWATSPRKIIDKKITTPIVLLLLEHGADQNIRDKNGKQPIDEVYKYTPEDTKELLLRYMEQG